MSVQQPRKKKIWARVKANVVTFPIQQFHVTTTVHLLLLLNCQFNIKDVPIFYRPTYTTYDEDAFLKDDYGKKRRDQQIKQSRDWLCVCMLVWRLIGISSLHSIKISLLLSTCASERVFGLLGTIWVSIVVRGWWEFKLFFIFCFCRFLASCICRP